MCNKIDVYIYILNYYRLYTGPNETYVFNVLSSPAYKKVMDNNVDLEHSFNAWNLSVEKTLKEPKRAYFAGSTTSTLKHKNCQVNFNYILTILI